MQTAKELLDFLPLPFNFIILILVVIFGSLIVMTIIEQIGKYARHRHLTELKRDLLDRGMSANEIHAICEAGAEKSEDE